MDYCVQYIKAQICCLDWIKCNIPATDKVIHTGTILSK